MHHPFPKKLTELSPPAPPCTSNCALALCRTHLLKLFKGATSSRVVGGSVGELIALPPIVKIVCHYKQCCATAGVEQCGKRE